MAHVGEELRLCTVGRLRRLLGPLELLFRPLALGDVGVDAGHAHGGAGGIALDYLAAGLDPAPLPGERAHAVFAGVIGAALEQGFEMRGETAGVLRMDPCNELRHGRLRFAVLPTEHHRPALAQIHLAARHVHVP